MCLCIQNLMSGLEGISEDLDRVRASFPKGLGGFSFCCTFVVLIRLMRGEK